MVFVEIFIIEEITVKSDKDKKRTFEQFRKIKT
jgi:hypothetical protein